MRKFFSVVGVLIAGFLLQVGVAPYISIGGVSPNFFVIIVVVMAMTNGSSEGVAIGFIAGMLLDLIGTGPLGPWALVLSITGYVVGLLGQNLFAEGWLLPVTVLSIASLFSELLSTIMVFVLGTEAPFWRALMSQVFPTAVYTIFISVLLFPVLSKVLREDVKIASFKRFV